MNQKYKSYTAPTIQEIILPVEQIICKSFKGGNEQYIEDEFDW